MPKEMISNVHFVIIYLTINNDSVVDTRIWATGVTVHDNRDWGYTSDQAHFTQWKEKSVCVTSVHFDKTGM
jgi:hypothetical protein